jgi:hypothetical protein
MSKACGLNRSVYGALTVGLAVSTTILVGTMVGVCIDCVMSLVCKGYARECSSVSIRYLMVSCDVSLLGKSICAPMSMSRITLESCRLSGNVCLGDENPVDGLRCDNGM